jgi:hypothetical protein
MGGIDVGICQPPVSGGACVRPRVFDIDLYQDGRISGNDHTINTAAVDAIHRRGGHAICYVSAGTAERFRPDYERYVQFDRRIGHRLLGKPFSDRFANVMVTILAFIVLGGGSAVALSGSNTVFSDDIVDNQVFSADVRNDTLGTGGLAASDLRPGSVGSSEVANGSLASGDLAPGAVGGHIVQATKTSDANAAEAKEIVADCPAGSRVTGGGFVIFPNNGATPMRNYAVDSDSWLVRATDPQGTFGWQLTVVANCAR